MSHLKLPEHLVGVFFDFLWDQERVWALPTPATSVPFDELASQLELTVWSTAPPQPLFDLAPRQVLQEPDRHPRHWSRVQRAPLDLPLEMFERNGRWVILDGYHRLARHCLRGASSVPVRRHPAECLERIVRDDR